MRRHLREMAYGDAPVLAPPPAPATAAPTNGTRGDDVLHGGDGKDVLYGLRGDDQLYGEGGGDVLVGGPGADLLNGGDGSDLADYSGAQAISVVFDASGGAVVHVAGDADDTLRSIERLKGSDGSHTFDITASEPRGVKAGDGDDTIYVNPLATNFKHVSLNGGSSFDTVDASHDTKPTNFKPHHMLNFNLSYTSDIENFVGSRFDDLVTAGEVENSIIHGMDGADRILNDGLISHLMCGDGGDDQIRMRSISGEINGGSGDDLLIFAFKHQDDSNPAALLVDGGDGTDTIWYEGFSQSLGYQSVVIELGRNGADGSYTLPDGTTGVLRSIENVDQSVHLGIAVAGTSATIFGNELSNVLTGGLYNDVIAANGKTAFASRGDQTVDTLTGGAGADTFLITNVTAHRGHVIATDRITDFSQSDHDKIDLSEVDAKPRTAALDHFSFIGDSAFTGHAGELRFEIAGGATMVMADTNGDKVADFALRLDGAITLTTGDFVL